MQYAHGISPTTTLPFSPPTAFRLVSRVPNHKNEKSQILEGHCHRCREWAPVEGVKCVEAKVSKIPPMKLEMPFALPLFKKNSLTDDSEMLIDC